MVKRVLTPLTLFSLFFSRYWQEAQTLCRVVSQRLADAQSQAESLEIKYSKAKRLVREYQSRFLSKYFSHNVEHYFYVSWTALCTLAKSHLSSQILTKTFFQRGGEGEKRSGYEERNGGAR